MNRRRREAGGEIKVKIKFANDLFDNCVFCLSVILRKPQNSEFNQFLQYKNLTKSQNTHTHTLIHIESPRLSPNHTHTYKTKMQLFY